MAQILVRNLDDVTVKRLKLLAQSHGCSLQAEVHRLLAEAAARPTPGEQNRNLERLRKMLAGRKFSDSTLLIREDRDRR